MSDVDMQNITREELLARYAAGERDFRGVILQYVSLDGVELEGVDFTGAIFNTVSFKSVTVAIGDNHTTRRTVFTNCNFSCSEWWFCYVPKLIGCNLQFAVMEGCYFRPNFVNCDWRDGQIIGAYFDEFIFEGCDLRNMRWSSGICIFPEEYFRPGWTILYRNTIDKNGVFHSGIHCTLPDPDDIIPF